MRPQTVLPSLGLQMRRSEKVQELQAEQIFQYSQALPCLTSVFAEDWGNSLIAPETVRGVESQLQRLLTVQPVPPTVGGGRDEKRKKITGHGRVTTRSSHLHKISHPPPREIKPNDIDRDGWARCTTGVDDCRDGKRTASCSRNVSHNTQHLCCQQSWGQGETVN